MESRNNTNNYNNMPYNALPDEMLVAILSLVELSEAKHMQDVDPHLWTIMQDIWKRRFRRHFPHDACKQNISDWIDHFHHSAKHNYKNLSERLAGLFYLAKENDTTALLRKNLSKDDLSIEDIYNDTLLTIAARNNNQVLLDCYYELAAEFYCNENNFEINPELHDQYFQTLLHFAVYCNQDPDLINALIAHGCDCNLMSATNETALTIACKYGRSTLVRCLLTNNIAIDASDAAGRTALFHAVDANHCEIIALLAAHGADVNHVAAFNTPLFSAIESGHTRAVKTLMAHNADVNYIHHNGENPLFAAIRSGNIAIVQALLKANINVNYQRETDGALPLYEAAISGNFDIFMELLNHGADINAVMVNGSTLMKTAIYYGHHQIVDELMQRRPEKKLSVKNNYNLPPLYMAVLRGNTAVINVLLKYCVDINEECIDGRSPLYAAVKSGHLDAARELLAHCANPNQPNQYGKTPLHVAASAGNSEMVKLLLSYHANPNCVTHISRRSPAEMATMNGRQEIVNMLNQYSHSIACLQRKAELRDLDRVFNANAIAVQAIKPLRPTLFSMFTRRREHIRRESNEDHHPVIGL